MPDMRKVLGFLAIAFALQMGSAFAIVGGPWDNNTYDGNTGGTYTGVIVMDNGSGIIRWSEGEEAQLSVLSESAIWYKGVVYFGTCFAVVDWVRKKFNGITSGRSLEIAGGPIFACSTDFKGKITQTQHAVRFQGGGRAVFYGEAGNTQTTTISPDGLTVTITRGGNDLIQTFRNKIRFRMYGSRTSYLRNNIVTAEPRTSINQPDFPAPPAGDGGGGADGF
jgi:hypothetical protein